MFKFIHAADIHLDSPLRGISRYEGAPVEEVRGASRKALENLVRVAVDRQVDFVLVAGDLYDGDWPDHNTGLFFVKQVTKLRDAGIAVYLITGNHDAASKMTRSLVLPNNPDASAIRISSHAVETIELEKLGVAIHGRGFDTPKMPDSIIDQYPMGSPDLFNIGMLHTSLESDSKEHPRYAPCKLADLIGKGYQYWALGHIHHRQILYELPHIVYSGNIQGRSIRETGAKGCMLVEVDNSLSIQTEFQSLDAMRWAALRIDVSSAEDEAAVLQLFGDAVEVQLIEHGELPVAMRVTFEGTTELDHQLQRQSESFTAQIRAKALDLSSGRVWVEKILVETRLARDLSEFIQNDGPIGALFEYVRSMKSDENARTIVNDGLSDLMAKLPPELKHGPESLDWNEPANLTSLIAEVEPFLLARLTKEFQNADQGQR